jgi:hypothetical protein
VLEERGGRGEENIPCKANGMRTVMTVRMNSHTQNLKRDISDLKFHEMKHTFLPFPVGLRCQRSRLASSWSLG